MFAKLKKKIEEEGAGVGPGLASPILPRLTSSGKNSPKSTPRRQLDSSSSSNYEADSSVPTSPSTKEDDNIFYNFSKEELIQELSKKIDKVKSLENRLCDYITAIKDHKKSKEKLELALEKQQDMSAKRIQELNESYQNNRLSLQAVAEKKELEWKDQFTQLETEKEEVLKKLSKANELQESYYKQMEEEEEMQGFQIQETAKVKHMFLNCQEELKKCQENLKERNNQLALIETDKKTIEEEAKKLKEEFDLLTTERAKTISERDESKNMFLELSKEKESLLKRLELLTKDFSETSRRLSHFELAHSNLQDDLDALKHTHEIYKNKTTRILEEKDTRVCHQSERILALEKRLNDSNLSGDDKVHAIVQERELLEQRLEEARQQLSEVKSTWSERVNSLEQQISHLNLKIAEDSQQYNIFEKEAEAKETDFQKQVQELTCKLNELTQTINIQTQLLENKDQLLNDQKSEWDSRLKQKNEEFNAIQLQLETQIASLESQLTIQENRIKQEANRVVEKNEEIEKSQLDSLEKELGWEKQLTDLENTIAHLKKELSAREMDCRSLSDVLQRQEVESEDLKIKIVELEASIREQTLSIDSLREAQNLTEENSQRVNQDKNQLLVRNAELSQQLQILKHANEDDKTALLKEVENTLHLQDKVTTQEESLSKCHERIKELEEESEQLIERSDRVSQLKKNTQDLESQLNDRNKTIKMQQQRLGDLKKTLQRELKIQSIPNEEANENNERELLQSTVSLHHTPSFFINQSPASICQNDNMNDEVSFRYLKHVVLKFMTSSECEAQQLIRAVAVVLRLSDEEERLVKQTLEWKMSWFGTKPQVSKVATIGKSITGTL